MAPPRTFDYDLVKDLLRQHPEMPYAEMAKVLTEDSRRKDPHSPRVLPDSVRRVVSQYRDQWQDEGIKIPDRGTVYTELLPATGTVAPSQRMATPLRYLREIAKNRRGEAAITTNERLVRRQALQWEAAMRENREIADITENGTVIIRPAEGPELDGDGNLVELAAWAVDGYQPRHRVNLRGRG